MLTKNLGITGVPISAVGQGTGDLFWDGIASGEEKVAALRFGLDLGMFLIDTGEVYGDGASERIVGNAIRGSREQAVLATKISPAHHGYDDVLRAAEGSLRNLGTDYIDVYQVHWPNPSIPVSETMEAMIRLVDSGKVRYVGLCNFTQAELLEAESALGPHRIVSMQNEYNLFERTIEYSGTLRLCQEKGISVMAYSPLDQGRIGAMRPAQLSLLTKIGEGHSKTVAQVILCWLVGKPGVVALVRSSNPPHIRENAEATDFNLTGDEIDQIDRSFQDEIVHVAPGRIRVSLNGEFNHAAYQTIEEALANSLGFQPSPLELSRSMMGGDLLKPVRLVPSDSKTHEFDLIGGRIRYWAWTIAHGEELPIPAYVRHDLNGIE